MPEITNKSSSLTKPDSDAGYRQLVVVATPSVLLEMKHDERDSTQRLKEDWTVKPGLKW